MRGRDRGEMGARECGCGDESGEVEEVWAFEFVNAASLASESTKESVARRDGYVFART